MVDEPAFHAAVERNIARGSALVAVQSDDTVVGGLLFSTGRAPDYEIGWLVVAAARRSQGIGEALVADAVRRWVTPPAELTVVTFGPDHPGARSRRFYERLGFEPAEAVDPGPEGGSRQRFRLRLDPLPTGAG
jgi:GNAT superfamily N-acetyltransferase